MITIETSRNKDIIATIDNNEADYQLVKFAIQMLASLDKRGTVFTINKNGTEESYGRNIKASDK